MQNLNGKIFFVPDQIRPESFPIKIFARWSQHANARGCVRARPSARPQNDKKIPARKIFRRFFPQMFWQFFPDNIDKKFSRRYLPESISLCQYKVQLEKFFRPVFVWKFFMMIRGV
jgi:hypothetical protein